MYRIETHLHTSEVSACASSTAIEMVDKLKSEGYDGMVVTDHFMNGNSLVSSKLSWHRQVNAFAKGYLAAKEAATHLDFDVFFAFEYSYHGADFLIYGLDYEWLFDYPKLLDMPIIDFFDLVHEHDGFIIHAHPFRERVYIKKIHLFTDYIDAVEVVNLGNDLPSFNDNAFHYAKKHHLPMTKGSDLHDVSHFNRGGMAFPRRPKEIKELIEFIKNTRFDSI